MNLEDEFEFTQRLLGRVLSAVRLSASAIAQQDTELLEASMNKVFTARFLQDAKIAEQEETIAQQRIVMLKQTEQLKDVTRRLAETYAHADQHQQQCFELQRSLTRSNALGGPSVQQELEITKRKLASTMLENNAYFEQNQELRKRLSDSVLLSDPKYARLVDLASKYQEEMSQKDKRLVQLGKQLYASQQEVISLQDQVSRLEGIVISPDSQLNQQRRSLAAEECSLNQKVSALRLELEKLGYAVEEARNKKDVAAEKDEKQRADQLKELVEENARLKALVKDVVTREKPLELSVSESVPKEVQEMNELQLTMRQLSTLQKSQKSAIETADLRTRQTEDDNIKLKATERELRQQLAGKQEELRAYEVQQDAWKARQQQMLLEQEQIKEQLSRAQEQLQGQQRKQEEILADSRDRIMQLQLQYDGAVKERQLVREQLSQTRVELEGTIRLLEQQVQNSDRQLKHLQTLLDQKQEQLDCFASGKTVTDAQQRLMNQLAQSEALVRSMKQELSTVQSQAEQRVLLAKQESARAVGEYQLKLTEQDERYLELNRSRRQLESELRTAQDRVAALQEQLSEHDAFQRELGSRQTADAAQHNALVEQCNELTGRLQAASLQQERLIREKEDAISELRVRLSEEQTGHLHQVQAIQAQLAQQGETHLAVTASLQAQLRALEQQSLNSAAEKDTALTELDAHKKRLAEASAESTRLQEEVFSLDQKARDTEARLNELAPLLDAVRGELAAAKLEIAAANTATATATTATSEVNDALACEREHGQALLEQIAGLKAELLEREKETLRLAHQLEMEQGKLRDTVQEYEAQKQMQHNQQLDSLVAQLKEAQALSTGAQAMCVCAEHEFEASFGCMLNLKDELEDKLLFRVSFASAKLSVLESAVEKLQGMLPNVRQQQDVIVSQQEIIDHFTAQTEPLEEVEDQRENTDDLNIWESDCEEEDDCANFVALNTTYAGLDSTTALVQLKQEMVRLQDNFYVADAVKRLFQICEYCLFGRKFIEMFQECLAVPYEESMRWRLAFRAHVSQNWDDIKTTLRSKIMEYVSLKLQAELNPRLVTGLLDAVIVLVLDGYALDHEVPGDGMLPGLGRWVQEE